VSGIVVRSARPAELVRAGEVTATAYAEDGHVGEDYLALLRDAAARASVADVLVAVEGEEIVGCVTLVPPDAPREWRETTPEGAATVRMLAVPRAHRRRGVGRLLALACIDRARAAGCPQICLLTQVQMVAAQSLYAELGFRRDPSLDLVVRPGLELMGFSLPLP
jgi:ribosomal protein S18 acetylase RimI-like enzyme